MTEQLSVEAIQQQEKELANRIDELSKQIVSGQDLLTMDIPETEYLIKPFFPKNTYIVLFGKTGIGKSWITLEIAKCLALGEKLFGVFKTKKSKVLYVDEENNINELKRRWRLLLKPHDVYVMKFLSMTGLKIDKKLDEQAILEISKDYDLIIFDSLREFSSKDENTSKDTQEIIDVFKALNRNKTTVLVIHHPRKDNQFQSFQSDDLLQMLRGSGRWAQGAFSALALTGRTRGNALNEINIYHAKSKTSIKEQPFRVDMIQSCPTMIDFKYQGLIETKESKLSEAKTNILEFLQKEKVENCYQAKIQEAMAGLGIGSKTTEKAIAELKENKEILPLSAERKKLNKLKGKAIYYEVQT